MVRDALGRPLRSLRLSVTDRCNLRCLYCMPEAEYVWLPREDLLTFEELTRLGGIFGSLGVDRLRLTGGEPLLRRHLADLVTSLAGLAAIDDLALTTNGVLLAEHADALLTAGLDRITVSLDTLRPDRFSAMTRLDRHADVLAGIAAAHRAFGRLKLDTVVMRGLNDDELVDLVEFGATVNAEVRFIEYMDVGGATRWSNDAVVSRDEILAHLGEQYGDIRPLAATSAAPAERYALPDGRTIGIIASTTTPFCRTCDRARLTADGVFYLCLYATAGTDLRGPLRAGASDERLREIIVGAWKGRTDRGAETRAALPNRAALVPRDSLKRDVHLEMHTRGG
jgi:cyclic pyranopterin phosphate synthase